MLSSLESEDLCEAAQSSTGEVALEEIGPDPSGKKYNLHILIHESFPFVASCPFCLYLLATTEVTSDHQAIAVGSGGNRRLVNARF